MKQVDKIQEFVVRYNEKEISQEEIITILERLKGVFAAGYTTYS
jgi:hypothetical protein